jgi:inhibitor of the pro-sigma K processing machinery
MDIKMLLVYFACVIAIFIIGKILFVPLKMIFKLILNSILGGILIWLINLVGITWGLHIGINVITMLTVGLLGVPGAVLLTVLAIFI